MKTTFKLFGLKEIDFLKGVSLDSQGIREYSEMITVRFHQADFDSEFEALKFVAEQLPQFEHGFEIVKTYTV